MPVGFYFVVAISAGICRQGSRPTGKNFAYADESFYLLAIALEFLPIGRDLRSQLQSKNKRMKITYK
jgi:hypothetical protein